MRGIRDRFPPSVKTKISHCARNDNRYGLKTHPKFRREDDKRSCVGSIFIGVCLTLALWERVRERETLLPSPRSSPKGRGRETLKGGNKKSLPLSEADHIEVLR